MLALTIGLSLSPCACTSTGLKSSSEESNHDVHSEKRSFHVIPTGNGHGFQLYDSENARLFSFWDHPYRYLRAPLHQQENSPERRNLLEDFSLTLLRPQQDVKLRLDKNSQTSVRYRQESHIIEADFESGGLKAQAHFFSPFGFEKNAMIAMLHVDSPSAANLTGLQGQIGLRYHLGENPTSSNMWQTTNEIKKAPGERIYLSEGAQPAWIETGQSRGTLIYLSLSQSNNITAKCHSVKEVPAHLATVPPTLGFTKPLCAAADIELHLNTSMEETGGMGVMVLYEEDPKKVQETISEARRWLGKRDPKTILTDSIAEMERWRVKPRFAFQSSAEEKSWRQSETVLRMAQIREPNIRSGKHLRVNHGMILASLPPGNWPIAWVRDGAYAVVALARMGHFEEAKKALEFFLNAEPVGLHATHTQSKAYRISVTRYYGSGEEECSGPDHIPNVEMDGWGLVLWAARQYLQESGDWKWLTEKTRAGTVYEALAKGIAIPIEENLERPPFPRIMRPDSSIWEVDHTEKKHYAYTTLTATRGICDFAAIAQRGGYASDHAHFSSLATGIRSAFLETFFKPGFPLGALERNKKSDLDSAVVESVNLGIIPDPRSELARMTTKHVEKLLFPWGGFARLHGDHSYESNEWGFINFRMASAYFRGGAKSRGQSILNLATQRAEKNFNLMPEMYNAFSKDGPIGAYIGASPMAGYGAGAYIQALLDREGILNSEDCGTAAPH